MRRSLTTAETVRLQSDSGRAARESRTNEINDRDQEIGPVQSATVLSDRGQDRLQQRVDIARLSVRQTLDGHWWQPRPLGWSFMGGRRHAS